MAGSIYAWSTTAASNASLDGDINWNEGQAPSTVNNSARQMMARVAEWIKDQGGALAAGGTANAITVAANSSFTSYATGQMLAFTAAANNGGPTTLSVNIIGAKSIRKFTSAGEEALAGGEIKAGGIFLVMYNASLNSAAGGWLLVNPVLASLTLTGAKIGTADYESYSGGPISALVSGTTTGALIAGQVNGNLVLGIRDNAGGDSASIISYNGTSDYSKLVARFNSNGTVWMGGNITPVTNDGAALGTASLQWSDLFLASGGVINWGNGNITLTHNPGLGLTLSGGLGASWISTSGMVQGQVGSFTTNWEVGLFSATGFTNGKTCSATALQSSRDGSSSLSHMQFFNLGGGGSPVGSIATAGFATQFNTSSDGRRKKNRRAFDSGAIIDALDSWLFDWIGGGTGYGVIAQDAQEAFPDAITEGEDGYLHADYSKFVPVLLRELKMLRARVAALEAE